jgi:sterol desaturase/sphingolipid hydroxylase (fatty acid hydroxylase superfamily)
MAQSPQYFTPPRLIDSKRSALAKPLSKTETLEPARDRLRLAAVMCGLCLYAGLLGAGGWLALHALPDQISAHVGGHVLTLNNIHHRISSDGLLVFGILPFALWVECVHTGWQGSSLRRLITTRTPSTKTDLAIFILGQTHIFNVLGKMMMLGASMLSGAFIYDKLHAATGYAINTASLPLVLQIAIYFFVYTFFDYWTHRLDHSRYFWPLHRFHHSADEFCVLTAGREHPAAFTSAFFINLPLGVLGAPPAAMLYVNVAVVALGFLIHSRIDSDWGWIGRWVVQSPNSHRMHHKLDMSSPTGHYALAPIWDRLFGTWGGEADQTLPIGVETPYRHGLWVGPDMARDYWEFWRGIAPGRSHAR